MALLLISSPAAEASGVRVQDVLQDGLPRRTDDPLDDRAPLEEQDRRGDSLASSSRAIQ